MDYKTVGAGERRWDAEAKVTGRADYTDDIPVKNMLHAKVMRAAIAHGYVRRLDVSGALKVPGVLKVLTPADVPDIPYATAGHPFALAEAARDVADRRILTDKIRLWGDEIAAVIAEDELAAQRGVEAIEAEYEALPFYLTPRESLAEGAAEIHAGTNNIIARTQFAVGDMEKGFADAEYIFEDEFETPAAQHCHMENQTAYAYLGADNRWVCVTSTQIPHICRRILGQAFGMPWGRFRVIKPFVGGGFGNKQDVTVEPLAVAMSMAMGGRPVSLRLTREEVFAWTRVRHAMSYRMKLGVSKDMRITAWDIDAVSDNGAYASHGHAVVAKGGGTVTATYDAPNFRYTATTAYTNKAAGGAMRGYGVPQIVFAMEAFIDNAARKLGVDPLAFRTANLARKGAVDPSSHLINENNNLLECIQTGGGRFGWDKRRAAARFGGKAGAGGKVRGVGMGIFSYASPVYPKGLEVAACRLMINQDGSVKLIVSAAEIGQGSDAVFCQMAAETLGVPYETVYAEERTDTDMAPFDTGAYASRQTYVTGMAVEAAAKQLKQKILAAAQKFMGVEARYLDIKDAAVVYKHDGRALISLGGLMLRVYYDRDAALYFSAEGAVNCHTAAPSMGVTFAEVEVDAETGKVEVTDILNVHDAGRIINPLTAMGQVEGGVAMGVAYGLGEALYYDRKTGAPLNNNLLDYKMPTTMDVPEMDAVFIERHDPYGPFGAKGLGEPPICGPAAAVRNAVCDALNLEINGLPLSPQRVYEAMAAGNKGGGKAGQGVLSDV